MFKRKEKECKEVYIIGEWNNWTKILMHQRLICNYLKINQAKFRNDGCFEATIALKFGQKFKYYFEVDGKILHDDKEKNVFDAEKGRVVNWKVD